MKKKPFTAKLAKESRQVRGERRAGVTAKETLLSVLAELFWRSAGTFLAIFAESSWRSSRLKALRFSGG
jgi:hypothetical protein